MSLKVSRASPSNDRQARIVAEALGPPFCPPSATVKGGLKPTLRAQPARSIKSFGNDGAALASAKSTMPIFHAPSSENGE